MDLLGDPIDGGIDSFEPRHAEDYGVVTDRGDEKSVFLIDASNGVPEGDLAIGMGQDSTVCDGNFDRGTRESFKVHQTYNGFINEVQSSA